MDKAKIKQDKIRALLNRKRKATEKEKCSEVPEQSSCSEKVVEEKNTEKIEQEEKAKKAILFEAKRAKDRAESYGPQGYLRPKSLATNKRFLHNTLKSTLPREKKKTEI